MRSLRLVTNSMCWTVYREATAARATQLISTGHGCVIITRASHSSSCRSRAFNAWEIFSAKECFFSVIHTTYILLFFVQFGLGFPSAFHQFLAHAFEQALVGFFGNHL